jgi:hypothetical protein
MLSLALNIENQFKYFLSGCKYGTSAFRIKIFHQEKT